MKILLTCFPYDAQNKTNTVITGALSVFPRAQENLLLPDTRKKCEPNIKWLSDEILYLVLAQKLELL